MNQHKLMSLGRLACGAAALAASQAQGAVGISDGSFESQGSSVGTGYCYFPSCAPGHWVGASGSGFHFENTGAWPGNPTPDGSYYAFLQNEGTISQTFEAPTTGHFYLTWTESGRTLSSYNADHSYAVFIGAQQVGLGTTIASASWTDKISSNFFLQGGLSYQLSFVGAFNPSSGDTTSYIDAVALNYAGPVPESATWAMMIAGFGLIGAGLRRTRPVIRNRAV
jgi:hypothetical protein